MSPENNPLRREIQLNTHSYFLAGSKTKTIGPVACHHMYVKDLNPRDYCHLIFIDYESRFDPEEMSVLPLHLNGGFEPQRFISTIMPRKEALAKAAQQGKLWALQNENRGALNAALEGKGACKSPKIGYTQGLLILEQLCALLKSDIRVNLRHARHINLLRDGNIPAGTTLIQPFKLEASSISGTGPGVVYLFFLHNLLERSGSELGVVVKSDLHMILRGSLSTSNDNLSDLTAYPIIMLLAAMSTECYVSPFTGRIAQLPFDRIFLISNQNNAGVQETITHMMAGQGFKESLLRSTPVGETVAARLVDIPTEVVTDSYGVPRNVFSDGTATIGCSRKRIQDFSITKAAGFCAASMIKVPDEEIVNEKAYDLARKLTLIETEESFDTTVTQQFLCPGGEDMARQACAVIEARVQGTRFLSYSNTLTEASESTLNNDIKNVYQPQARQYAQSITAAAIQRIEEFMAVEMQQPQGYAEIRACLLNVVKCIEDTVAVIRKKSGNLDEQCLTHEINRRTAGAQLAAIEQSSLLRKLCSGGVIRQCNEILYTTSISLVSLRMQILANDIAIDDFLQPVTEYLARQIEWLDRRIQSLEDISKDFEADSQKTAEQTLILEANPGFEFTDSEFLRQKLSEYIDELGGKKLFCGTIVKTIIAEHGSLRPLVEMPATHLTELLKNTCKNLLMPLISHTTIRNEIENCFDEKTIDALFLQMIQKSDGSLLRKDDVDNHAKRVKVLCVPDEQTATFVMSVLSRIDTRGGTWQVCVDPLEDNRITFYQVLGHLGYTQLLYDLVERNDRALWDNLSDRTPDQICISLPKPNPSAQELARSLVKALLCEMLIVNTEGQIVLKTHQEKLLEVGKSIEQAQRNLIAHWPDLIFVDSTFGRQTIIDQQTISEKLERLKKAVKSPATDPRYSLITSEAVEDVIYQIDIRSNWAQSVREAIAKGVFE